jgi:hypothetical protein
MSKDNLEMFIIDGFRHGGGSTLEGILKRLNDYDSIGWRAANGKPFSKKEIHTKVMELGKEHTLVVEDLNNDCRVLSVAEIDHITLNEYYLITNTKTSLAELAKWKPRKSM